jgi:hypothetical protein
MLKWINSKSVGTAKNLELKWAICVIQENFWGLLKYGSRMVPVLF